VAFALSRLSDPQSLGRTPIGVFRSVARPTYDALMAAQLERAAGDQSPDPRDEDALDALLAGRDAWLVP
jgi:2-oxoglutarate ferredoxin oxidoreductase subunit beta